MFPTGSEVQTRQLWDYNFNVHNFHNAGLTNTGTTTTIWTTISGKGIVTSIKGFYDTGTNNSTLLPTIIVDGVSYEMGSDNGASTSSVIGAGNSIWLATPTSNQTIFGIEVFVKFKTSFSFAMKNVGGASGGDSHVSIVYYT